MRLRVQLLGGQLDGAESTLCDNSVDARMERSERGFGAWPTGAGAVDSVLLASLIQLRASRGLCREDAEDATQEFLSGVVRGDLLRSADPAKGKFRTFLLVAWKRFLIDQFRRSQTLRRGGDVKVLSLDFGISEQRWLELESREPDPNRLYALSWASSLLDQVRSRLQASYARRDRSTMFAALIPRLTEPLTKSQYDCLADELSVSASDSIAAGIRGPNIPTQLELLD